MKTFLEDFYEGSNRAGYPKELARAPGSIAGRVWGVLLVIDADQEEVYLVRIHTPTREVGKGYGGRALRWLCSLADRHQLPIRLYVQSKMHRNLSTKQLHSWYAKNGFNVSGAWMVRKPKAKLVCKTVGAKAL